MLTLILVRHAKTEQLAYNSLKSDFERELKPRGYSDTELVADQLLSKDIVPDLLITSKATRANQTANILAEKLGIAKPDIIGEQFIYDGYTTSQFISYLNQFENQRCIMVVGHNPEIAMMAINLSGSDYLDFPTTATIGITFDAKSWKDINAREGQIAWFITPKMLK